jgi:hypothetical protein
MTFSEFRSWVESKPDRLLGVHPHSEEECDQFESQLGYRLPKSLRWLLIHYGCSRACGVEDLAEAVDQTIDCRNQGLISREWLILNDYGDGGVVMLNLVNGGICWCDMGQLEEFGSGRRPEDATWFDGFEEWAASRLTIKEINERR